MPSWSSAAYLKFLDERMRPARDMLARVALADPRDIVDLGCGPGASTELLRERWSQARVLGLDSSTDMIATARAKHSDGEWLEADISSPAWLAGRSFDLLFSNAALQWVPDHAALLPRLFGAVNPGGVL